MIDKILARFERMTNEDLFGEFSDFHKDVNGYRPRHIGINDREAILEWIRAELENTLDYL